VTRWHSLQERVDKLFSVQFAHRVESEQMLLTDLWLTPKGAVIAALVLEAHTKRRIVFPEWEMKSNNNIPANALVAPLSSESLNAQAEEQRRLRRDALQDHLKEATPKIVAESMRNSNSRGYSI